VSFVSCLFSVAATWYCRQKCCLKSTLSYLISFKPVRKTSCDLPLQWNAAFLWHRTLFFLQASQPFFHIAVNLGKHCFCKCGRRGLHLSFVTRIVLTKLNIYIIPFFCNLTTLHCYYSTIIIALSVFITICIFLDAYQRSQAQQQKFAPVKKLTFRWTTKMHISVEQKSPVCLLSDANREHHILCDYRHPLLLFK